MGTSASMHNKRQRDDGQKEDKNSELLPSNHKRYPFKKSGTTNDAIDDKANSKKKEKMRNNDDIFVKQQNDKKLQGKYRLKNISV